MSTRSPLRLLLAICASALATASVCSYASAEGLQDDGGASWRLEQPAPPALAPGESLTPIGLGKVGDIEFLAPDRGLLITAGNGSTIPASVWAYNGRHWYELSSACGATDGRIAWAGPDEFWTISDGRPGQAANALGQLPPLEDDTLCRFAVGASGELEVAGSYASLAFQASSYQPMHAAGCLSPSDCWFAGDPLPEGQVGAFHLHWNGSSLTAQPYSQEGHPVEDMREFGGQLYESVRVQRHDLGETSSEPPILHAINPKRVAPTFEPISAVPLYASEEFAEALDALHLSAGEGALWGASGPQRETPAGSEPGQVTVARLAGGVWSQLLGPGTVPSGQTLFPEDVVNSIAAEPGANSAWIALETQADAENPSPTARALVARISAEGVVSTEDEQSLPTTGEGFGPKGAAAKIACPAEHDCWMVTTQGWLFHLAAEGEQQIAPNGDPAFGHLITYRPPDAGVPPVAPDAPPEDDSGLLGEPPATHTPLKETVTVPETRVAVPLLSRIRSRLVHGSTLELRFHLAVKARVRLLAKRRRQIVASTPRRTLAAGNRKLLLRLDPHSWPTKLDLQTHALAALPTTSTRGPGTNAVSTSLVVLPDLSELAGWGSLR